MGGNALNFSALFNDVLQERYDLIIASSLNELSTWRCLYPNLAEVPILLYFHENQCDYPVNSKQQGLLEIQIRSIYAAMTADQLSFNSTYNRKTFLQGVEDFCQKMPDGLPQPPPHPVAHEESQSQQLL